MKNYLSFGGGVNSVAMYLYLMDQGVDFEAVFVDHGTDWPETYDYVDMFKEKYPLTILKPEYQGHSNLYDYSWFRRMVPSRYPRWCTANFKIKVLEKYYKPPCFVCIGIDAGESHRAKLHTDGGVEHRYPLIEGGINRAECKEIIKRHVLPVPMRSGCYICPYQTRGQWIELRRKHPCLFQDAVALEARNNEYMAEKGKGEFWLSPKKMSLSAIVSENQSKLWAEDEYPPCECGL